MRFIVIIHTDSIHSLSRFVASCGKIARFQQCAHSTQKTQADNIPRTTKYPLTFGTASYTQGTPNWYAQLRGIILGHRVTVRSAFRHRNDSAELSIFAPGKEPRIVNEPTNNVSQYRNTMHREILQGSHRFVDSRGKTMQFRRAWSRVPGVIIPG